MFYLFIHALIITKISVLVRVQVGIRWILGGVREELVGDWGSYSGDIVYFVLFKEYIWGLIQLFARAKVSCIQRYYDLTIYHVHHFPQ